MPAVLLHSGHIVSWSAWYFEPTVITGAFIVCSFYLYFALRLPGGFDWLRAASFYTGAAVLFLSLVSPLDAAADRLISMHMLQHIALTTIGPPLVLLGLPPGLLTPVFRWRFTAPVLMKLTNPMLTASLFIVNMWLWHAPPMYEAAVTHTAVHATMHIAFIATGLLFWWPIIQPEALVPRVSEGGRLLYLFVTGHPMGLLALLLIASGSVVYPYYDAASQPVPLWGISPLEDQQVAGLIMGLLGEAASFIAISLLFLRFLDRENESQEAAEAAAAASSPTSLR